ncbi:MAG: ATP-binding cassette domain-containing protein [Candidatus Delongbacteria bacterium]|jgi:ABC-type multidrug transport system ATPase subunit/putative methionine-R-sulfoxide reductase with GAF domain|nr:ATP-binding cassette domain-containing protein [Candidatus Delongbacteria bacterium]
MNDKLSSITKGLDSVKDLKSLLIKLTDITKEILNADRCSIFLYDEKADDLFTYVAHGVDEIRISKDKGIAGHTYTEKKFMNIKDVQNEPLYNKASEKVTGYATRTMLSIPVLSTPDNAIGVFQVLNKNDGKPFNEEDEELLRNMASYAASLLNKAMVYADSMKLEENEMQSITSVFDDGEIGKISASIIPLRITDDLTKADVFFHYEGLQVFLYQIESNYIIIKKDEKNTVSVDNYILEKDTPFKILYGSNIKINSYTILYEQIKSYFKVKLNYFNQKTFYLNKESDNIILSTDKDSSSIVTLNLSRSIIKLEVLDEKTELFVNRIPASGSIYLNINDDVKVNSKNLNIKKIVSENVTERDFYHFDPDEKEFTISNKKGDALIADELDYDWTCSIKKQEGNYLFQKQNCPYDIYLNSRKVLRSEIIRNENKLYLNGRMFSFDTENKTAELSKFSFSSFIVKGLKHLFNDNSIGLDDISFEMEHGDLVAIMGPSGCGKSTLLNVINGYQKPNSGDVVLDNFDLYRNYAFLKNFMGFVPQDDLLFDNLTVYENLYFNAKLRYPSKPKKVLEALVNKVLKDIGLLDKKGSKVGNPLDKTLSGGQRKRLNIGLELLSDSEVLLLDEPTSGLSSKDSEKIVELLKSISLEGKIVYVIIHQPSSKIYKIFDKIIVLDKGGKLAFSGDNYDALKYFREHSRQHFGDDIECPVCKNVEPDLILETIEEPARDRDGTPLDVRKRTPEYWKNEFLEYQKSSGNVTFPANTNQFIPPRPRISLKALVSQFTVLLQRNFLNKLRDKSNLAITFLEAPLLGIIIGLLLRYSPGEKYSLYDNKYLITFIFLSTIVTIFFALTNSIDEIIRDASILLREKMLDINSLEYYLSKFITLVIFSVVQNILFLSLGFWIMGIKELFFEYLAITTFISVSGICMGMAISSIPKLTSKAAQNIIPLILVPQIIFGGFIVEFEDMSRFLFINKSAPIPEICQIMPSRWGFEALCIMQDSKNSFHSRYDSVQKEFDDLILNEDELKKELGRKEFNNKKAELLNELDEVRNELKESYGNAELNNRMKESAEKYELAQSSGDNREISSVYPMFTVQKECPLTGYIMPAYIYNSLILLLFSIVMSFMSVMMLVYREKIAEIFQKIQYGKNKN